jgi:hypothetical protein
LYSATLLYQRIPGGREFTAEEKKSISVLIIRPERKEFMTNFFGGNWIVVAEPFGDTQDYSKLAGIPLAGSRFTHYATQPQSERYSLQILRRVSD